MNRSEYLDTCNSDPTAFRKYYGQFVNDNIKNLIANRIGVDRIRQSQDPHLNDIPLKEWDALMPAVRLRVDGGKLLRCNEGWSLCTAVCIAKEAARQLVETL